MTTWKKIKPKSNNSRRKLKDKFGSYCFLEPKQLKYPICNQYTGKVSCKGLNAANYFLNINIGKLRKMKSKTNKKKLKKYIKLKRKSLKFKKKCIHN